MKIELSDRVALYAGPKRAVGVVVAIEDDGTLEVRTKDMIYRAHPKQCWKLVKKRNPKKFVSLVSNWEYGDNEDLLLHKAMPPQAMQWFDGKKIQVTIRAAE